jgi:hypothetical protein
LLDQPGEIRTPPENRIHMTLDGEVTTSFEWMGAGRYRPDLRSGAMHGGVPAALDLYYGSDGTMLFVRLDGAARGDCAIEFESGAAAETRVISGRVVEMETPLAHPRFRVRIARDGLPPALLPPEGWLELS